MRGREVQKGEEGGKEGKAVMHGHLVKNGAIAPKRALSNQ